MSANHHLLDEPILSADQDALGRGDFADSVADLILTAPQGFSSQVIGLYGKWGEGKTSLKNMVLKAYTKACKLQPLVVEFSPWTYTSRERLPFLFFTEIAHVFGNETKDEKAQKLADQFKQFGQILEIVSLVPQLTLFAMWVKPILNFFGTKYADQTKNLESVRKQIHDMMADEPRRLIVVVDDLDRISAKEVRRMIQLVKANGDFPNITYLLLCDREYVGRALCTVVDGSTVDDGREYLEKVVTFGLDLPRIRQPDLRHFLLIALKDVLDRHQIQDFDPAHEVSNCVFQLVHDLRDAKRLVASFEFQVTIHRKKGDGTASVNLGDLLALEACRLFEPEFYHALYANRRTLLCTDNSISRKEQHVLTSQWFDQNLARLISDKHRSILKEFADDHLGWEYSDSLSPKGYSREEVKDYKMSFRLSHPDRFERYFNFYADPSEFSKADLQEFFEALSSKEETICVLKRLYDQGRLRDFLVTIERSLEESDPAHQENFVAALALLAELASDALPDMHIMRGDKLGFTFATHVHRCVRFFLERSVASDERSGLLMRIFKHETNAVVLPVSVLSAEYVNRERQTNITRLLNDVDYADLKQVCVERIESLQSAGKLIGHVEEKDLRRMWVTVGNPERIKVLLANDFLSYPAVMHALSPFTGWSQTGSGTFYTINLDWIEEFADPTSIIALLSDHKGLPPTEEGIKNCLVFAVQAKRDKQPYDHNDQLREVYKQTR